MNNFLSILASGYYTGEATKLFGIFTMYAVCILIGILVAAYHVIYEGKKLGINSDTLYLAILFAVPLAIVGARIWYVLFNLDQFSSFAEVLGFRNGHFEGLSGLGIHGGVIVAIIVVFIYCKVRHLDLYKIVDIAAPSIMIGQIFGRWGNFFNHELYGPVDTTGFVEHIPLIGPMMYIDGAYRMPTFLIESMLNLVGVILMLVVRRKVKQVKSGDMICFYLVWYGWVRILTESLRLKSGVSEPLMAGPIPVSILISAIFIFLGVLLFILKRVAKFVVFKEPKKEYPTKPESGFQLGYYFKVCYVATTNYLKSVVINVPQKSYIDTVAEAKANRYEAVIFDLDGTLLDSKSLIDQSVIYTFEKHRPDYKLTEEEIDSFFGPTLQQGFGRYAKDEDELQEMIKTYREYNIANHDIMVKAFPRAKETLRELKRSGLKIAVVSSKKSDLLLHGLEICGLDKYVDIVCGYESVSKPKPDPEGILKTLKDLNVTKAAYVGDTKGDIEAAIAAHVTSVGVLYIKHPEIMMDAKPDYVISNLYELVKMFGE